MAYIGASDIKTYLDISGTADDSFLTALIDQAKAVIDRVTKRTFSASATSTRLFDAVKDVRNGMLLLDQDLATASGLVITNGDGASIIASQYILEPPNKPPYYGIRLLASANVKWAYNTDPENAIGVTGKFAFSTTAPDDIKHATRRLVAFLYRQKDNSADIDRPIIAPDGSVVMPQKLPNDVMALLMPYVRNEG